MDSAAVRCRKELSLREARVLLARTPAVLDASLRDLPDGWGRVHEGGESWSPFDVVGHLIHGARVRPRVPPGRFRDG